MKMRTPREVWSRRRRHRVGFALALVAALGAAAALGPPRWGGARAAPPDAADAALARDVARELRDVLTGEETGGAWSIGEAEFNAVLASASRLADGFEGRAEIGDDGLAIAASLAAAQLPGAPAIPVTLLVAPSEDGIRIASASLAGVPVPASMVAPIARAALDRYLGEGLGSAAWDGVRSVSTEGGVLTVGFAFSDEDRRALLDRIRRRGLDISGGRMKTIFTHLWWLDREGAEGGLPHEGSALPYLVHAVQKAAELVDGNATEELSSALLALGLYCGDPAIGRAIGVTPGERMRDAGNHCRATTLRGRVDLRQHFTVSAALAVMSGARTATGVGELKELLDSGAGGSGFSFDDMAANAAGVRFARTFLDASPEDWPAMLARIEDEDDLLPALDGLPSGLSEAEFRARYGDLESAAYADLVAEIDARVAALPLHGGGGGD